MDVYIAFTEKQLVRIDEWKKELPKPKKGFSRIFSISFIGIGERDKDNHLLFKALMKTNDGHKLMVTRKAAFH